MSYSLRPTGNLGRVCLEELAKLRSLHKAYAKQTEIEGLSKYSRPTDEKINLLSTEILLRQYNLGEGISRI